MNGKDYVAVRELSTREGLVAAVGERCDRVPVESLEWLLRCGRIAPVADDVAPKPGRTRRRSGEDEED